MFNERIPITPCHFFWSFVHLGPFQFQTEPQLDPEPTSIVLCKTLVLMQHFVNSSE